MSRIVERPRRGATAYIQEDLLEAPEVGSQGALYGNGPMAVERLRRIEELTQIRDLADDWDGEGSVAPGPEITDGAIAFALTRARCGQTPPNGVTPGVNGTIYFEWHTPHGYYEAEVYSPCDVEVRFVPAGTNDVIVERCPTGDCEPGYEF